MTTPTIRPIHGENRYCGPAILAALSTGNTDHAAITLELVTGRENIRGVDSFDLDAAIRRRIGYRLDRIEFYGRFDTWERPTLAAWFRRDRNPTDILIVDAGNHWMLVQGPVILDNSTRAPVPIRGAKTIRRRSRVYAIYRLRPLAPWETTP